MADKGRDLLPADAPLAATRLRGVTDTVHSGSVVAIGIDGKILYRKGAVDRPVFLRSLFKPFRALSVVETGALSHFGLGEAELAVISGSHSGRPEHLAAVRSVLEKLDLDPTALQCPPRRPLGSSSDTFVDSLLNDCSGEHAGVLAVCVHEGVQPSAYLRNEVLHELHRKYLRHYFGRATALLEVPDRCGLPTWGAPLENVCHAFLKLCKAAPQKGPARSVLNSIFKHPDLYTGPRRLVGQMIANSRGNVFGKDAAEGLYCFVWRNEGVSVALKFADGTFLAARKVLQKVATELGLPCTPVQCTADEDDLFAPLTAL
jgi:L-asparaginase II